MRLTPQVIADLYPSLGERLQGDLGRDAAFDLYLAFLSEHDIWEKAGLVFKGGTAVRKFHCSPDSYHRISYDLDFSLTRGSSDDELVELMSSKSQAPPFGCHLTLSKHNRLALTAPFLPIPLSVACDLRRASPILTPAMLPMQHRPMHDYYDMDMSREVPVMTVDETVAEKLTRWHLKPMVRDLYDLTRLRPLISDTSVVTSLYVIKAHQSFHNPNKGPTTSLPKPVDVEGIIYAPSVSQMDVDDLQLDVPMPPQDKRDLVASMLSAFPDRYGFCLEELRGDLETWGDDIKGSCKGEVEAAAQELRGWAGQQPQDADESSEGAQQASGAPSGNALIGDNAPGGTLLHQISVSDFTTLNPTQSAAPDLRGGRTPPAPMELPPPKAPSRRSSRRRQAYQEPPRLQAPNQRESRALPPHPQRGMGLRPRLDLRHPTQRGPPALHAPLQ